MIVFDLDGTLALDSHRSHHFSGEKPLPDAAWASYFAACEGDEPNWPLIRILDQLLSHGEEVEVWSGRSASVATATARWFGKVFDGKQTMARLVRSSPMPWGLLLEDDVLATHLAVKMRHESDRTNVHLLKQGWLSIARSRGKEVTLVFEDRQRVVDMWRAAGVVCCQVSPGNF